MKEKRISLRFRTDNEQDMKVWKLLEKTSREKNASKNSIVIEHLLSALEHKDTNDALAEQIAELVILKLGGVTIQREAIGESTSNCMEEKVAELEGIPQADEPAVLGEDALDFLDIFG